MSAASRQQRLADAAQRLAAARRERKIVNALIAMLIERKGICQRGASPLDLDYTDSDDEDEAPWRPRCYRDPRLRSTGQWCPVCQDYWPLLMRKRAAGRASGAALHIIMRESDPTFQSQTKTNQ